MMRSNEEVVFAGLFTLALVPGSRRDAAIKKNSVRITWTSERKRERLNLGNTDQQS